MRKRFLVASVIAAMTLILTSCGVYETIDFSNGYESADINAYMLMSESDANTLIEEEILVNGHQIKSLDEFTVVREEGKTYYKYSLEESRKGEFREYVEDMYITTTDEYFVINKPSGSLQYGSSYLTIKFPKEVKQTNGDLLEDRRSVRFDISKSGSSDSRIYASFVDEPRAEFAGATDGGVYKKDVTLNCEGYVTFFEINGAAMSSNRVKLTSDGYYQVKVCCLDEDVAYLTFQIDKTKPSYKIKRLKKGVAITFYDKGSGIKSATLNGKKIKSGRIVTKRGSYKLRLVDRAGNVSSKSFKIKK